MIKALSLLIATTALTTASFAADTLSIREQKVNRCKQSSQFQGDHLVKACSKGLSFKNKIVISGFSFKMTETRTENRLDLGILDSRGIYYYMPEGVPNSIYEPSGKIEIVKIKDTDKAVVYRLNYSAFDSEDSFFRVVTLRLRSNLVNPRKTCVVAVSDSKDHDLKLEKTNKKAIKALEKDFRDQAKDFIASDELAKAECITYEHNH